MTRNYVISKTSEMYKKGERNLEIIQNWLEAEYNLHPYATVQYSANEGFVIPNFCSTQDFLSSDVLVLALPILSSSCGHILFSIWSRIPSYESQIHVILHPRHFACTLMRACPCIHEKFRRHAISPHRLICNTQSIYHLWSLERIRGGRNNIWFGCVPLPFKYIELLQAPSAF